LLQYQGKNVNISRSQNKTFYLLQHKLLSIHQVFAYARPELEASVLVYRNFEANKPSWKQGKTKN
jgi:hypothetical protein